MLKWLNFKGWPLLLFISTIVKDIWHFRLHEAICKLRTYKFAILINSVLGLSQLRIKTRINKQYTYENLFEISTTIRTHIIYYSTPILRLVAIKSLILPFHGNNDDISRLLNDHPPRMPCVFLGIWRSTSGHPPCY